MIRDFALPDLGEGLTESEIVAWRVAVGDRVELNQIIADVETAKAVVELPSPFAGVVTALHAAEGETIDVGAPLFSCETGDGSGSGEQQGAGATADGEAGAPDVPAAPPAGTSAEVATDAAPGPNLVGYGARDEGGPKRRARRSALVAELVPPIPDASASAPAAEEPVTTPATESDAATGRRAERPRSTPPVRKLARDLGIDLETVTGTGERGLITRDDVELAASAPSQTERVVETGPPAAADDLQAETRIPIKGVRKHTAAAMVRSAFTAPHVTEFLTIDVTGTMELLRSIRDDR
ncbi:MAG TPA: biotin/lipoyl-containing protein, partial [Agromyces sp.]|nr:biotin/lipoyl-containing protein [Agromyces sp.]